MLSVVLLPAYAATFCNDLLIVGCVEPPVCVKLLDFGIKALGPGIRGADNEDEDTADVSDGHNSSLTSPSEFIA